MVLNYTVQNDIEMLYTMCLGTQNAQFNTIAQILPIFNWDLSVVELDVHEIQDLTLYQKQFIRHIDDIEQLKTQKKCQDGNKKQNGTFNKFQEQLLKNPFLVPFHLINTSTMTPLISLLVEQSHAFKLFYTALNQIIFQKQAYSRPGTNYILADGSRCGKTTYDIALLLINLFHPDLKAVPVLIQNKSSSEEQSLSGCNNFKLDMKLNKNYISAVKSIDLIDVKKSIVSVCTSNILDFMEYPQILNNNAKNIHNAVLQQNIVKNIIHNQLNINNVYQKLSIIDEIIIINTNLVLTKLCNYVKMCQLKDKPMTNYIKVLLEELNSNNLEQLFILTKQINISKYPDQPKNYFVIIDEVCNRKANINDSEAQFIDASNYSKFFQLIDNMNQIDSKEIKQNIILFFQNNQNQFGQISDVNNLKLSEFLEFIQKLPQTSQIFQLVFPLSLFFKNSQTTTLDLNILNAAQLSELMSTQGFEAIMLRDMSNQLYQIKNNYKYVLTQIVIRDLLLKSFGSCDFVHSLNDYLGNRGIAFVTTLFSGTCCSLSNFFKYSTNLATSMGSRTEQFFQNQSENNNFEESYLHSSICVLPQLHPSLLNQNYYINGINSVISEGEQKYELHNKEYTGLHSDLNIIAYSNNILNAILCCNTNATGFIQTIFAQVSPQLIIYQKSKFITGLTQETYMGILPENDFINKINFDALKQTFISKALSGNFYIKRSDELLSIRITDPVKSIFIQPLTQQNLPQLANVVNEYIKEFMFYIKNLKENCSANQSLNQKQRTVQSVAQLIIDSQKLLGKKSQIFETLALLLTLFVLQFGIDSQIVKNMEQIMLIVYDAIFNPTNENIKISKQLYYGICNNVNENQNTKQLSPEKIYVTVIQAQFVSTIKQQNNTNQEQYIQHFIQKNIEATKVVADYVLKLNLLIDMVVVAVPIDQMKLFELIGNSDQAHSNFLITIHFRQDVSNSHINQNQFNQITISNKMIFYILNEIGDHSIESLFKKACGTRLLYITTQWNKRFNADMISTQNVKQIVYSSDVMQFFGQQQLQVSSKLSNENQVYLEKLQINNKDKSLIIKTQQVTKFTQPDQEQFLKTFFEAKFKAKLDQQQEFCLYQFSINNTSILVSSLINHVEFNAFQFKVNQQNGIELLLTLNQENKIQNIILYLEIEEEQIMQIEMGILLSQYHIFKNYCNIDKVYMLQNIQFCCYFNQFLTNTYINDFEVQLFEQCQTMFSQNYIIYGFSSKEYTVHFSLQHGQSNIFIQCTEVDTQNTIFSNTGQEKQSVHLTSENITYNNKYKYCFEIQTNQKLENQTIYFNDYKLWFALKLHLSTWFYEKQFNNNLINQAIQYYEEALKKLKSTLVCARTIQDTFSENFLTKEIQNKQNIINDLKLLRK
ncbi:Hypothetical_protein [Hexamita inflata]|uniref:Hypothetical_protein n=1 Tax=Hexamita inflata TaxID=28002 RepID=A0AA86R9E8_9EUKA|nr:Hypothetical protein HINF_LOCUS58363 [Hexamita inflata]